MRHDEQQASLLLFHLIVVVGIDRVIAAATMFIGYATKNIDARLCQRCLQLLQLPFSGSRHIDHSKRPINL